MRSVGVALRKLRQLREAMTSGLVTNGAQVDIAIAALLTPAIELIEEDQIQQWEAENREGPGVPGDPA